MDLFFTGLHQTTDIHRFRFAMVSINRLRKRLSAFKCKGVKILMDSGAFSELSRKQDIDEDGNLKLNDYRKDPGEYASEIIRWKQLIESEGGELVAAVSQDYMCESFILEKTGMTVLEHQEKTIARYDELLRCDTGVYILPVLQGYEPRDYLRHLKMYGTRLAFGAWVGVGSICKRNSTPQAIEQVLLAIHQARPDLKIHGFGLKITAFTSPIVRRILYSSDSMAWSFHARMHGRDGNSWFEAYLFTLKIQIACGLSWG